MSPVIFIIYISSKLVGYLQSCVIFPFLWPVSLLAHQLQYILSNFYVRNKNG